MMSYKSVFRFLAGSKSVKRSVDQLRNRFGKRTIVYAPSSVRGGNLLYLWQYCFRQNASGSPHFTTLTEHMTDWLREFPLLNTLTLSESPHILDRRVHLYPNRYGVDFSASDNDAFVSQLLDYSDSFRSRISDAQVDSGTVVINVRRGDYYSVPRFAREFAIDVPQYILQAREELVSRDIPTSDLLLVSDDVDWCRENLTEILGTFRTIQSRSSIFDDLATIAAAPHLVLANSTFSYWGAYMGSHLGTQKTVIAPPYHSRLNTDPPKFLSHEMNPEWYRVQSKLI